MIKQESTVVELLLQRASRATARRPQVAMRTYHQILKRADSSPRQIAIAAIDAGQLHAAAHELVSALECWGVAADGRGAPFWLSCVAWMNRGDLRFRLGDAAGAVCDFTAVLVHASLLETHQEAVTDARVYVPPEYSPLELMGCAATERGRARVYLGDDGGAVCDLESVMKLEGISRRIIRRAWARLAEVNLVAGRYPGVIGAVQQYFRQGAREEMRLFSALAHVVLERPGLAILECDAGLQGIVSIGQLDRMERHLRTIEQRHGRLEGLSDLQDRFLWRRQELTVYAPFGRLERDF